LEEGTCTIVAISGSPTAMRVMAVGIEIYLELCTPTDNNSAAEALAAHRQQLAKTPLIIPKFFNFTPSTLTS
jgi:hypothetical protein